MVWGHGISAISQKAQWLLKVAVLLVFVVVGSDRLHAGAFNAIRELPRRAAANGNFAAIMDTAETDGLRDQT